MFPLLFTIAPRLHGRGPNFEPSAFPARRVFQGIALLLGLADADDGDQSGAPGRFGLLAHQRIGFAVVGAALGMADDDGRGAGIGQHFRRQIAGVGAGSLGMTILGADRELGAPRLAGKSCDQGGGRAHQQIGLGGHRGGARDHGVEFGHGRFQAVHFPVARDQRPDGVGHVFTLADVSVTDALAEACGRCQMQAEAIPGR